MALGPNRMSWRSWPIRTGDALGLIGPARGAEKVGPNRAGGARERPFGCWQSHWRDGYTGSSCRRRRLPRSGNAFRAYCRRWQSGPYSPFASGHPIVFTLDDYVAKGILPAAGADVFAVPSWDRKNILWRVAPDRQNHASQRDSGEPRSEAIASSSSRHGRSFNARRKDKLNC